MKILIPFFCLFSLSLLAAVETEFSGNLEGQARHSWNSDTAQDELFQNWDEEDFYLIYGNIGGKMKFKNSRLETNWFGRHSTSVLYKGDYIAPKIFTFPTKLVARDVFKLQYKHQQEDYYTESILNKFFYEWDMDEHRFMVGRMYINYGLGEIFNPINPFNQPTGLTAIQQIAQGNDGFNFKFYIDEKYSIDFYFLGDKSIDGYEGEIDRTIWAHGEYFATDDLQFDYVIGEDQKRQKLGGQVSYNFEKALVFVQSLYQTAYVDKKPSHNLLDVMVGYDQQLTQLWHVRLETGYQKVNRYATIASFGERFLPSEYFVALANQYEIHPLVKLSGTIINDIKSGFTYFIAKNTYSITKNTEAELFGFVPVSKGDDPDNVAQKLVTTDVGVALRAFF